MKISLTFFLSLHCIFCIHAQNLVPNPSIEFLTPYRCPYLIDNWYSPNSETTDFLSACSGQTPVNYFGIQNPFDGIGYCGIRTYSGPEEWSVYPQYREYLAVKLIQPLERDSKYKVSFKYSVAENAGYTCDRLGIVLSEDPIQGSGVLNYMPQIENPTGIFLTDSVNWNTISGDYIANGGEQFIAIGNFYPDNQTHAMYYKANPGIYAKYYTYVYIDYVEIVKDPDYIPYLLIPNLVTANGDQMNDSFKISTNRNFTAFEVSIYNCWGAKVFESTSQTFEWTGDTMGVYYYQITTNKSNTYKGWVHVIKQ
ncbi:gliding motility-associated C-terminal domain-containing protein [Cytophaga aurantiaca]|uniref:T9SS type B sorting domain-containing protein n=1 Tax=Cytophaga aurantiaca TaxID=29530 RepID=UPI000372AA5C|nr:gliding motility-associated C-terminal domain-containing protein [Cytophaga aurantiaca]